MHMISLLSKSRLDPSTTMSARLTYHASPCTIEAPNTPPLSPKRLEAADDIEASRLATEIREIYADISGLADLKPRAGVNALFSRLVDLCIKPRNERVVRAVLEDTDVQFLTPRLRQLCSDAEAELERFWANEILRASDASPNSKQTGSPPFPGGWSAIETKTPCPPYS